MRAVRHAIPILLLCIAALLIPSAFSSVVTTTTYNETISFKYVGDIFEEDNSSISDHLYSITDSTTPAYRLQYSSSEQSPVPMLGSDTYKITIPSGVGFYVKAHLGFSYLGDSIGVSLDDVSYSQSGAYSTKYYYLNTDGIFTQSSSVTSNNFKNSESLEVTISASRTIGSMTVEIYLV